jgi:hypothetical protein
MPIISVSKTRPPVFPPWCPCCGQDCGDQQIKLRTLAWDSTSPVLKNLGPLCWIKLPGCKACNRRLLWATYGRRLAYVACFAAGILFVGRRIGWENMRQYKVVFLLGVAAFVIPPFYWELMHPRPIELSIDQDELTFTFTRDDYAVEFADLNGCKAAGLSSEFEQPS